MDRYCPKCFERFQTGVDSCPHDGSALVSFADRDLVGETLDGRYEIQARVGRGGMGVVYRALHSVIGRTVALKVLNSDAVKDETALKRFLVEGRAMASLKNPHTITLYDFGATSTGLLYYTMELLEGKPLSTILREDGRLAPERAVDFVLQTCESLEEAHRKQIVHRDLKPDNIFVVREDGTGREFVKVLDFGIAKLMGEKPVGTLTATGVVCGTPAYLSPEQVMGGDIGPPSDLYSLGVVLYEMLGGRRPFSGKTSMEVLLKHLNEPVPPFTTFEAQVPVPGSLELFVRTALAKQPAERFSTVEEFCNALRSAAREASQGGAGATETLDVQVDFALEPTLDSTVQKNLASRTNGVADIEEGSVKASFSSVRRRVPWKPVAFAAAALVVVAAGFYGWANWTSGVDTVEEKAVVSSEEQSGETPIAASPATRPEREPDSLPQPQLPSMPQLTNNRDQQKAEESPAGSLQVEREIAQGDAAAGGHAKGLEIARANVEVVKEGIDDLGHWRGRVVGIGDSVANEYRAVGERAEALRLEAERDAAAKAKSRRESRRKSFQAKLREADKLLEKGESRLTKAHGNCGHIPSRVREIDMALAKARNCRRKIDSARSKIHSGKFEDVEHQLGGLKREAAEVSKSAKSIPTYCGSVITD
jgi:eukaryotic-like serine/threonine-protein kinase